MSKLCKYSMLTIVSQNNGSKDSAERVNFQAFGGKRNLRFLRHILFSLRN
jgi:hypothetical protein